MSRPTSTELSALIARVAARDRQAFALVYRATSAKLFGIVSRICREHEVAEEVLQEVYVKVWERAADFDSERASPITWLATIARNRALDEVRRAVPVSLEDEPAALDVADGSPLAFETLVEAEEGRKLADCLEQLEPERRQLVRIAYLDGLSRAELAQRLGRPIGTIKTWLHRSLAELADCMRS